MKIYIGNKAIWNVPKYTFNDPHMGVRTVSIQVEHPAHCLDDTIDNLDFKNAYVTHKGETYYISSAKPTGEKSNANINYQYSLIFKGKEADLDSRMVRDLAIPGIDTFISQGTRFVLSADLNMFAQLIQSNLNYYFDDTWVVNVDKNESEQRVDIDNLSILELLKRGYEVYGARWRFSSLNGSNVITLNYQADVHPTVMNYGRVGGLAKITRTSSDAGVYNRVIGHGGSRNLPVNYFANRYDGFPLDPDPISGDVNIKNLMPKAFRDSVKAGITPYHDYAEDAASIAEIGVRETVVADNDSIYPSIAGVSKPNIGRIDQIIAYAERDSQTFDIWVKDIGFDLADDQYTTTEEAKISFTNGYMAGYEFIILGVNGKRRVVEDTSKSHNGVSSKYKITLIKSEEDSDIGRPLIPYPGLTPKAGDNFVIYHIEMPHQYVLNAEERLQEWLEEQLDELKKEKPTYAIELYQGYYKGDEPEMEYLKSGNKLTIQNDKLSAQQETLYINSVTIEYGDIVVPKITLVVSDKIEIDGGRLNSIENRINKYESDQYFSNEEIKSLIRSVRTKDYWFLDEDGNLYTDRSVYSLKGVSALGLGSEGGGGGGDFDRLDDWADYTAPKAGWVLSALLGYDLHTRVNSLEAGGGGGGGDIDMLDSWANYSTAKASYYVPASLLVPFRSDILSRVESLEADGGSSTPQYWTLDEDGNLKTEYNVYSTKGVSALGLGSNGDGGGGGTSYDRLDTWANYDSSKAGWVLSALLGKDLDTRVDALNSALTAHTGNSTIHITSTERTNWNDANSKKHTHSNKAIIDQITQSNIDVLAKLSIVDGNIKVDTTLWATGGISALGLGDGGSSGGSGGGVDMLDSWANYTPVKSNYYVPASLLVPFRNDTLSRLTSLESGSATSIVTTGSGNAVTSLTKSGSVITANKGLSFALSSHTHTIAQITGLQGALDSKATQSDITTAINGIEIGGRNLIIQRDLILGYITGTGVYPSGSRPHPGSTPGNNVTTDFIDVSGFDSITLTLFEDVPNPAGIGRMYAYDEQKNPLRLLFSQTSSTFTQKNSTIKIELGADVKYIAVTLMKVNVLRYKLEKGTIATDWTPAPEDQVSDWNVTDVNSFAFLKNKPTQLSQFTDNIGVANHIANKANPHAVTSAQIGALPLTGGTLRGDLIMSKSSSPPWANGINRDPNNYINLARLSVNISNNGLHFFGDGRINARRFGIQSGHEIPEYASAFGILELNPFGGVVKIGEGGLLTTGNVTAPTFRIGANWTLEPSGTELVFKYKGVIKQRMLSDGTILAVGGITALST